VVLADEKDKLLVAGAYDPQRMAVLDGQLRDLAQSIEGYRNRISDPSLKIWCKEQDITDIVKRLDGRQPYNWKDYVDEAISKKDIAARLWLFYCIKSG